MGLVHPDQSECSDPLKPPGGVNVTDQCLSKGLLGKLQVATTPVTLLTDAFIIIIIIIINSLVEVSQLKHGLN